MDSSLANEFPTPPRKVRLRAGSWQSVWMPRVASVVFGVLTLWVIAEAFDEPLTLMLGHEVSGQILEVNFRYQNRSQVVYSVSYEYPVSDGGRTRTRVAWDKVSTRQGVSLPRRGESHAVRILSWGPLQNVMLSDVEHSMPLVFPMLLAVLAAGIFTVVWTVRAWVKPAREKELLRYGRAVRGTITDLPAVIGDDEHYPAIKLLMEYAYEVGDGKECNGSATVGRATFESLEEGQEVTVIYWEDRPHLSVVYETSRFEVG